MSRTDDVLFNADVWRPALEKFAAVTNLTVVAYGADHRIVCGPVHPTPLFDLFSSLEGPDERRLDFFSRYRLGGEQFANYLAEQHDLTAAARLDFSGHTFDGARRGEVASLPDDVVFLTAKEGKKRAKRGRVGPFTVSSSRLRAGLERLLASHDDAEVSEWSWRFNEVTKSDLVGRIRGLWSVKAADIR